MTIGLIKMFNLMLLGINGFILDPILFTTSKSVISSCMSIRNRSNQFSLNLKNPTDNFNSFQSKLNKEEFSLIIQGNSIRTWSYKSPNIEQVQVELKTDGRPLDSEIELWQGPDNTPFKMRAYLENGKVSPFNVIIETPRGPNTIAIRNIGQIEFPITASVFANNIVNPSSQCLSSFSTIQGGALRTYPFTPIIDSVQILLKTDGRPLNSRIELLQGPNNNKQIIELYTEDGCDRPFFCIISTPRSGNVIRVVNTAPIEFPLYASVVPNTINRDISYDATIGGDIFSSRHPIFN